MYNKCNHMPEEADLEEQLAAAKEHGLVPVVVIFCELLEKEGRKQANIRNPHFLWGVDEGTVLNLTMVLAREMFMVMQEDVAKRARRN